MKTLKQISAIVLFIVSLSACTDSWDSHYSKQETEINNERVEVVNMTVVDYLTSSTEYSKMTGLFREEGILEAMVKQNLLYTVLVANDDVIQIPVFGNDEEGLKESLYFAQSNIAHVSLSPSKITDGLRLLVQNGKFLNISQTTSALFINDIEVKKIIKLNDGFVYELTEIASAPRSLYETIENLDDEHYSIFKEMVLSKNERTFDKSASIPLDLDASGNTIYDSVFVTKNQYFLNHDFDLFSESVNATLLIPSNELILQAKQDAKERLDTWGRTRADSIIHNWIFQVAFFNEEYNRATFEDVANIDLYSIFDKQWRTTVNKVDLDNPITMSNGTAYYMTELKIPTNVLIFRIKEYMRWYEFLSAEDKDKHYIMIENMEFYRIVTNVSAWSAWPEAGWSTVENRTVAFKLTDKYDQRGDMEFLAYDFTKYSDGSYDIKNTLIPPGEYYFHVGFDANLDCELNLYVNGVFTKYLSRSIVGYSYDRSGGGFPEGFDYTLASSSNAQRYDRDGGEAGIVVIPDGPPSELRIRYLNTNHGTSNVALHHWCLRPTENNY